MPSNSISLCRSELYHLRNSTVAKHHLRFFKTGPGEYGAGDLFLGVKTPPLRALAKKWIELPINSISELVKSKWHEERMLGLMIWTYQYEAALKRNGDLKKAPQIYRQYIKHFKFINNWDLVDISCHKIVGWMLREAAKRDKKVVDQFLAKHSKKMPRTMLRYTIEKYPETQRKRILRGEWTEA